MICTSVRFNVTIMHVHGPKAWHMRLNLGLKRGVRKILATIELGFLWMVRAPIPSTYNHPDVVLLLIYRHRNRQHVERLLRQLGPFKVRLHLWALDDVASALAPSTVGRGPGQRNDLLNELYRAAAVQPHEFMMISDDDVEFPLNDVGRFIFFATQGGFMISQPAHLLDSFYSFGFTCVRPHLLARATKFVEIGPVVLIHPLFQGRIFPMRSDFKMGWASTIEWHQSLQDTESFGIVDAVGVRHCSQVGLDYDTDRERLLLNRVLLQAGINTVDDILFTVSRWYRWSFPGGSKRRLSQVLTNTKAHLT